MRIHQQQYSVRRAQTTRLEVNIQCCARYFRLNRSRSIFRIYKTYGYIEVTLKTEMSSFLQLELGKF